MESVYFIVCLQNNYVCTQHTMHMREHACTRVCMCCFRHIPFL